MVRHNVLLMMHYMLLFMVMLHRSHRVGTLLAALCNPLQNAFVLNVVGVVGLDVGSEAVECPLKCIFRGGVHHARLSPESVTIPLS